MEIFCILMITVTTQWSLKNLEVFSEPFISFILHIQMDTKNYTWFLWNIPEIDTFLFTTFIGFILFFCLSPKWEQRILK